MKHLVTREEADDLRAIAAGDAKGSTHRIFLPPPDEAPIGIVSASGRSRCRECGEPIEKDADAIVFGFDAYAREDLGGSWAKLARAYIHLTEAECERARLCRVYPEED